MNLIIEQVGKCTRGVWRIRNISYTCESGKVIGVIGNNGAGKTTLLGIISGLSEYSEGVIKVKDDFGIHDYDPCKLAGSCISINSGYKNMTGREMLRYITYLNSDIDEIEVDQVMRCWDIPENKKFNEFSLGMKVRLNLAMAMIKSPSVLILDEVFNGLDPAGQKLCKERIVKYARDGHIVFVSSHNLFDISEISDEVIFMKNGRLVKVLKDNLKIASLKECFEEDFC